MEWQELQGGLAKRFVLEDDTSVVALLRDADEGGRLTFYADASDLELVEAESEKLGELRDLIDALRPEDIIEIYCQMGKVAKEH